MKSLDTNILLYAVNRNCTEHHHAYKIYETLIENPGDWIISDQVLFEFFCALQNAKILENPLKKSQAIEQIEFIRNEIGCLHCSYCTNLWTELLRSFSHEKFGYKKTYDTVLAYTLADNNVDMFYTRNVKDFDYLDLFQVINPID